MNWRYFCKLCQLFIFQTFFVGSSICVSVWKLFMVFQLRRIMILIKPGEYTDNATFQWLNTVAQQINLAIMYVMLNSWVEFLRHFHEEKCSISFHNCFSKRRQFLDQVKTYPCHEISVAWSRNLSRSTFSGSFILFLTWWLLFFQSRSNPCRPNYMLCYIPPVKLVHHWVTWPRYTICLQSSLHLFKLLKGS